MLLAKNTNPMYVCIHVYGYVSMYGSSTDGLYPLSSGIWGSLVEQ